MDSLRIGSLDHLFVEIEDVEFEVGNEKTRCSNHYIPITLF